MKNLKIRKNRDKFAYGEIDLNNLNQLLKEEVDEDKGMDIDEATELAKPKDISESRVFEPEYRDDHGL